MEDNRTFFTLKHKQKPLSIKFERLNIQFPNETFPKGLFDFDRSVISVRELNI